MERAVIVEKLVKEFEVTERGSGLVGAVKTLISPKKRLVHALKGISFSVSHGELVGFIGPNGAGKTTTLKILSGVLHPTTGFVQVAGHTPWDRKPHFLKKISLVMGQKNQLWWDLPAIETFELNRAIYEIPERAYRKNLTELIELLEVEPLLGTQVRRLSLGQRMRLELIAALLHRPEIVFLDEPTIGLDVIAQQKMRDFIASFNHKFGATILLTSHNMDDVASLAKRVIVIADGAIIFDGNLKELVSRYAKNKILRLYVDREIEKKELESIGKVISMELPEIVLSVPRGVAKVAAAELLSNFPIDDLNIEEESLESVIARVFKGEAQA